MEQLEMQAAVEAILFTTGRAVSSEDLGKALGVDTGTARKTASALAEQWNAAAHGTDIIQLEDAWQMCTRKAYYPQLITLELHPKKPKLTEVLLETLSVVAYKQPVTKAEVERIRGVNSDHAVNRLVEFGLVQELGRAKLPGRPILFGTTQEFLRAFGVASSEQLPEISTVQLEDFRTEAEEEADASGQDRIPEEKTEEQQNSVKTQEPAERPGEQPAGGEQLSEEDASGEMFSSGAVW